jgi:hypothetical protein
MAYSIRHDLTLVELALNPTENLLVLPETPEPLLLKQEHSALYISISASRGHSQVGMLIIVLYQQPARPPFGLKCVQEAKLVSASFKMLVYFQGLCSLLF